MRHNPLPITLVLVFAVTWLCVTGDKVTFQDDVGERAPRIVPGIQLSIDEAPPGSEARQRSNQSRQGKDLLDWIGLGTGQHVDPYLARTNEACLNGDFAECFKSRALGTFADFFDRQKYDLNDNVKIVRMPSEVVEAVSRQSYEFTTSARSDESEWDQLVKFVMRKTEKFIKTTAIEVDVPAWLTGENEVYAPRFIDEIADEIDTLENKKDTLFSRNRLKRIFIPMLIILKLFKLKLLLFLPLILGLASFKKFLGFIAIVIPGLIGFFKLCKPLTQSYTPPVYSPSGIGFPPGHFKENHGYNDHDSYHPAGYSSYQDSNYQGSDNVNYAHDLAYQGYRDYQK
ncbi:uncharacterized protein LOC106642566 [Copidosoma floridanum]|uniref:uncharacterized protein LOC106642566 n=1 Tax=Copidosoma floridanum TaxID=29053 RepID=UPI0006C958E5|nr:uncharacterized protein LOC106642566 [Copidosoma floridanum]